MMQARDFEKFVQQARIETRIISPSLSEHLRDEVINEAWLSYLKRSDKEPTVVKVLPWFRAVLRHKVADVYRKKYREEKKVLAVNLYTGVITDESDHASENEWKSLIRASLARLSPLQHAIVFNRFYNNRSLRQLAEDLKLSKSAVARECANALSILRELISHKEHNSPLTRAREHAEFRTKLALCLRKMPHSTRTAFFWVQIRKRRIEEVGSRLNVSTDTIRSYVSRGHRILKNDGLSR